MPTSQLAQANQHCTDQYKAVGVKLHDGRSSQTLEAMDALLETPIQTNSESSGSSVSFCARIGIDSVHTSAQGHVWVLCLATGKENMGHQRRRPQL